MSSITEHPLAWMTPRQAFQLLAGNLFTMTEYRFICDHMPEVVDFTPDFQWGENGTLDFLLQLQQQDEYDGRPFGDDQWTWVCTCDGSESGCECGGTGGAVYIGEGPHPSPCCCGACEEDTHMWESHDSMPWNRNGSDDAAAMWEVQHGEMSDAEIDYLASSADGIPF